MGSNASTLVSLIQSEIQHPVTVPMSLAQLALLVGLVAVLSILWSRVLSHLRVSQLIE